MHVGKYFRVLFKWGYKSQLQQFLFFPAAMALMLLKEERIDFTSAIG